MPVRRPAHPGLFHRGIADLFKDYFTSEQLQLQFIVQDWPGSSLILAEIGSKVEAFCLPESQKIIQCRSLADVISADTFTLLHGAENTAFGAVILVACSILNALSRSLSG